jgi:hypothetical protein
MQMPRRQETSQPVRKDKVGPADKSALEHLAKHVNSTIEILHSYKKKGANREQVAEAFRKLIHDTSSGNTIESKLAKYIINELSLLRLKVKEKGEFFTAIRFLEAYWQGEISDVRMIEEGFEGLAGPAMLTILKNCKLDPILSDYT